MLKKSELCYDFILFHTFLWFYIGDEIFFANLKSCREVLDEDEIAKTNLKCSQKAA